MNIKLIKKEELNSSNSFAQKMLKEKSINENFVIWANKQTNGRGQRENTWWSKPYKSLTFSLVIQNLNISISNLFILNILSSLAVYYTLKKEVPSIQIKWPNDLLISKKKICGILIENSLRGEKINTSIIGIGLNVNEKKFPNYLNNAISLYQATSKTFNRELILNEIINNFFILYNEFNTEQLLEKYYNALLGYKQIMKYKDKNGIFEGKIIEVEKNGQLIILDTLNQTRKYLFKEVEFLL